MCAAKVGAERSSRTVWNVSGCSKDFSALKAHLAHHPGGRAHGCGLLGLGVNANQRDSAHRFAGYGNHVSASSQVGLHLLGRGRLASDSSCA